MPDLSTPAVSRKAAAVGTGGLSAAVVLFCYANFVTKYTRTDDVHRVEKIENWAFESVPMSNHMSLEGQVNRLTAMVASNCMAIEFIRERRP
jgi:hypothetical protein